MAPRVNPIARGVRIGRLIAYLSAAASSARDALAVAGSDLLSDVERESLRHVENDLTGLMQRAWARAETEGKPKVRKRKAVRRG